MYNLYWVFTWIYNSRLFSINCRDSCFLCILTIASYLRTTIRYWCCSSIWGNIAYL